MYSVGIDVGTTTTQVVFSQLELRDTARTGGIPRVRVTGRTLLYQGDITMTPLLAADRIDAEALVAIVGRHYQRAGFAPDQIETGAVIITGEIAHARNAASMLDALSELAGDFVVTVAGPNVEAQIAGRGSGAAAYSADHYTQVTSVDIGGGTANAAVFRAGKHISSSGLAVGGRQIQVEATSGRVVGIAPAGRRIIEALGLPIREGAPANLEVLRRFCNCMADLTADLVAGRAGRLGAQLQLTPPLAEADQSRVIFLCGGVATYYYEPIAINSVADVAVHGDIGPLFAQQLRTHRGFQSFNVARPAETVRATVLGAASQTVTLSGSTIWADRSILPLRNLAVIDPQVDLLRLDQPDYLAQRFREAAARWDISEGRHGFALVVELPRRLTYPSLQSVVEALDRFATPQVLDGKPLVLILEHDYAQVIGQTLSGRRPDLPLISIDQVGLGEGDFIDLGAPILKDRVVPLSIKTLIFYE
ncbi:MAG: ethanolamine utilization protein EutA [Spirochaetaceae bacterium]|nr:MAG: ethanolamine utilization protein EutA [Spirochaetaceae bacterium]